MFAFVYLLNFILLWVLFFVLGFRDALFANIRLAFVKSMVLMAFLTVVITEGLSYFNILSFLPVLCTWSLLAVGFLTVVAILLKMKFIKKWKIGYPLKMLQGFEKKYIVALASSFLFIILPLFFLAIFYPPNNSDSLGYHLPRIEHWIQNCGVKHYITNDIRQLYTPPLPEFVGLHLRLLSGGDFWLNIIQFFAMLGCLFLVSLMVRMFGLNYKYQILSMLLTLSIGMGILQATTTQTDYVCAFFLCAFLFWGMLLARSVRLDWRYVFWGALALGLGFLTKPLVGVFAVPFALVMAVVYLRKWRWKAVGLGFVFLFFILLVNMPFLVRNYQLCGNCLGDRSLINLVQNEKMNGVFLASNIIRNVSTHVALPFANSAFNKIITFSHQKFLWISPEERAITFGKEFYEPFFCINEDCSGNFFIMLLLLFLMGYLFLNVRRLLKNKQYFFIFYFLSLLSGYVLFSFMFKWQPWITRLDLPFFIIAIPFMVLVLHDIYTENSKAARVLSLFLAGLACYWLLSFAVKDKAVFFVTLVLSLLVYVLMVRKLRLNIFGKEFLFFFVFLFTIPYVYFNSVKPLACNFNVLLAPRERKYFRKNEKSYKDHLEIAQIMAKFGISSVGILSSGCINEYLLWIILKNKIGNTFTVTHLNTSKILSKEIDVFEDQFFKHYQGKYVAVVAYMKNVLPLFEQRFVVLSEVLGTLNEPLLLIILETENVRKVVA